MLEKLRLRSRWMRLAGESGYDGSDEYVIDAAVGPAYKDAPDGIECPMTCSAAFSRTYDIMGPAHMSRFLDVASAAVEAGFVRDDDRRRFGNYFDGLDSSFFRMMFMRPLMHDDAEFLVLVLMGRDDDETTRCRGPVFGFKREHPRYAGPKTMLSDESFEWMADMLGAFLAEAAGCDLMNRIILHAHAYKGNMEPFSAALLHMRDMSAGVPDDPAAFARALSAAWLNLDGLDGHGDLDGAFGSLDAYERWSRIVKGGSAPECLSTVDCIRLISGPMGVSFMDGIVAALGSGDARDYSAVKRVISRHDDDIVLGYMKPDAYAFENTASMGVDGPKIKATFSDHAREMLSESHSPGEILGTLAMFDIVDASIRGMYGHGRDTVSVSINGVDVAAVRPGSKLKLSVSASHGAARISVSGATMVSSLYGFPSSSLLHVIDSLEGGCPMDMVLENPILSMGGLATGDLTVAGERVLM